MKKSIKVLLTGLLVVPMLALGVNLVVPVLQPMTPVSASSMSDGASAAQGDGQATDLFGDEGLFKTITNTALYLIGAISVFMLIYGGIRYTISGGDSKGVEAAKNTILYAVVGIIVAALAYAIVNFVLTSLVA